MRPVCFLVISRAVEASFSSFSGNAKVVTIWPTSSHAHAGSVSDNSAPLWKPEFLSPPLENQNFLPAVFFRSSSRLLDVLFGRAQDLQGASRCR